MLFHLRGTNEREKHLWSSWSGGVGSLSSWDLIPGTNEREKHLWSSWSGGVGSLSSWDLILGLQNVPPPPYLTATELKAYLQQFLLPHTSCLAVKKKKKKITRHTKRQNPTIWRDIANIRTRHGRDVGIVRPEIKTSIINMLRAQMDKRTSMQNQVGNVNREIEVLRKNQKEM